jgi:hypothetical protein
LVVATAYLGKTSEEESDGFRVDLSHGETSSTRVVTVATAIKPSCDKTRKTTLFHTFPFFRRYLLRTKVDVPTLLTGFP